MSRPSTCRGVVGDSFVACGESDEYGNCLPECSAETLNMEHWYRFEDVQYAPSVDEFDYPRGDGQLTVELRRYEVLKQTPKGVWPRLHCGDK